MKISVNWLSEYVDVLDIAPHELAERLTLSTAEVEGFEIVGNAANEVMVAEVVKLEPLAEEPDERGLSGITLDTGRGRVFCVSGAPNLRVGMKTVLALPGAHLPAGEIRCERIGDRLSEGMLCSAAAIGLGAAHEGILECPTYTENGTRLSRWIPSEDILLDFDNKSLTHRPDLWGHYGFAREIAAVFDRALRPLAETDLSRYRDLPPYAASNEARDDCPCFTCLAVDVEANEPSSLIVQGRLLILGLRPWNCVVDATNYVALELGQPTHAYDRDLVRAIRVAPMGTKGVFRTLDGVSRMMLPEDLMIWNEERPIAIAGIMGGAESSIGGSTTHTLLESANFRAARVRATSVRLGLRTDASQRFEKGQPPANAPLGLRRLVRLLEDGACEPAVVSRATVLGNPQDRPRSIAIPSSYVRERAGADISTERVEEILGRLGFGSMLVDDMLEIEIPPFRSAQDIGIPTDILEEVLRIHGYGAIPPQRPAAELTPTPAAKPFRRENRTRRFLAQAHGFVEVENYVWFDDDWLTQLGYEPGITLRLRNPVSPTKSRLRTTLMPSLLRVAADNVAHEDDFRIFEVGRVFVPNLDGQPVPDGRSAEPASHREEVRVAAASVRPADGQSLEAHYREVKGAIEDLGRVLLVGPLRTGSAARIESGAPWQLPASWAPVLASESPVGSAGILAGAALELVAPQRQLVWFELSLDDLEGPLYPDVTYVPFPSVPGSRQDFSILWREGDNFQALERVLDTFHHPLVQRRDFVTLYRGRGLPPGVASYTFRYWLGDPQRTLTGKDLDAFREQFLSFLAHHGISLR
jgi:phenylalanyl-tRNA synthetase beta chain